MDATSFIFSEYLFDSRRRSSGTASNPVFTFAAPTTVTTIQVIELEIPVSWYVINSGNNKLDFNDGAARTATITPGNYTRSSLAPEIKAAMEAVSALTFTVTIDRNSLIVTIAATGPFSILLVTGPNAPTGTGMSIEKVIGFARADTGSAVSHSGSSPINLAGENYIFVTSPIITGTSIITPVGNSDLTNALGRLQVVSPPSSIMQQNRPGKEVYIGKENVATIEFGLRFQDNTDVDLNGLDWSILVRLSQYGNF